MTIRHPCPACSGRPETPCSRCRKHQRMCNMRISINSLPAVRFCILKSFPIPRWKLPEILGEAMRRSALLPHRRSTIDHPLPLACDQLQSKRRVIWLQWLKGHDFEWDPAPMWQSSYAYRGMRHAPLGLHRLRPCNALPAYMLHRLTSLSANN
jgi:hypothetical protein